MAPMLVALKCSIRFQKRALTLLIRQTSSYHVWDKSRINNGTNYQRQRTYAVSVKAAGVRGRGVFTKQGQSLKWL